MGYRGKTYCFMCVEIATVFIDYLIEALQCAVVDSEINLTMSERKERAEFYKKALARARGE